MAISGSCLCGGVRFEIEKAVGPVEICHCNRCRKTTGSASLPAIGVMTERDLPGIVADAIKAARDRGAELAQG